MNTNIKRVVLGALLLLAAVNVAHAGWVATPAVDAYGRSIYVWTNGGGSQTNPNPTPEIPPTTHAY